MANKRIKECFDKQVAGKRISRKQANIAIDTAQALYNQYAAQMSQGMAEAAAVQEAVRLMQVNVQRLKESANIQIVTQANALRDAAEHAKGGIHGGMALLTDDITQAATYSSVEGMARAVRERLTAMIGPVVNDFKSTHLGFKQDVQGTIDIVHALFGQSRGNAKADEFAAGFTKANKYGVERLQKAGVIVDYREDYRLAQRSNPTAMKNQGKAKYVSTMMELYRKGHVLINDFDTQLPMTPGDPRLPKMLEEMFDNQSRLIGPKPQHGGKGFGQLNERRVIHWQTAEGWLEHNRLFGYGDQGIYDALIGHIDGMATDIAIAERLGPKPQSTINAVLKQAWEAQDKGAEGLGFRVSPRAIERTWSVLNGSINAVDHETLSAIAGGVRNTLTATRLQAAPVTAVPSDTISMMFAAHMNGIGAMRMFRAVLESLTSSEKRAFMKRMEVHAADLTGGLMEMSRYGDEMAGVGSRFERGTAKLAEATMRVNGLAAWTNTMKRTFMMEYAGYIADNVGKAFDKIDAPLREWMTAKGIDAAQWDVIRKAPLLDYKGAKWFDFHAISDDKLGDRMAEIMMEQRRRAILEPSAGERQITTGAAQRGTVWGETARSLSLFKSFTLTMMSMQMYSMFRATSLRTKLEYGAFLLVALPMAGMVSMQARQIINGKDPLDMTDYRNWMAAVLQGGGIGIMGDFIGAAVSPRTSGNVVTAMQGPVVGLGNDAIRLAFGGYREMLDGEKTKWGSEAVRFLKSNMPGTNLWYARLVMERLVWDKLQQMVDPNAYQSFRRMESKAWKDREQTYWSRPGEGLIPERGPSLGAALGQTP